MQELRIVYHELAQPKKYNYVILILIIIIATITVRGRPCSECHM